MSFCSKMKFEELVEFDYQSLLETCGLQDEEVDKIQQQKEKANYDYQEEFDTFKKLRFESKNLELSLFQMRSELKKNIGRGVNNKKQLVIINDEIDTFFEDIKKINSELKNLMKQSGETVIEMDNKKRELLSQFVENAIDTIIQTTEESATSFKCSEQHLRTIYEKVHTFPSEINIYQNFNIISPIIEELQINSQSKISNSKFAEKEKNIAFLMKSYKNKMAMMEALS